MSELIEISSDLPVLVVDSAASFRDLIGMILKKLGFRNVSFSIDAVSALQYLRKEKFGFMICDRNLAQCSGMELLKEIRENVEFERIPFLMMAAGIPKEDVVLASELGIDGYLKKPFVINDVSARLTVAITRFRDPENPEALFENARQTLAMGHYEQAEAIYQDIKKRIPNSARATAGTARCARAAGNLAVAEASFKRAIEMNPMYVHAYHELGVVYLQLDRIDDALIYFEKAISISPSNPIRYESIAEILMEKQRWQDAENYLMKAVKLELAFPNLYALLGKALFAQKKNEKAIEYFHRALNSQPNNTSFLNSLGISLKAVGKYEDAIDNYNKALKLRPSDVKILFNKALCLVSMKEWERARKTCLQILKFDPSFDKAKTKMEEIDKLENTEKSKSTGAPKKTT